jgi:Predicted membrane protein (DUF2231)
VFETAFGIPAHPLLIHAPVIFVPLLIVGALVFGLVPRWRARLDWAVAALAVVAPISCLLARQSGLALRARLVREHAVSDQDLVKISAHAAYGTRTFLLACALGVLSLVLVGTQMARARRGTAGRSGFSPLTAGMVVLVLVAGAATGYYVFRTGDTGAHIVWQGR